MTEMEYEAQCVARELAAESEIGWSKFTETSAEFEVFHNGRFYGGKCVAVPDAHSKIEGIVPKELHSDILEAFDNLDLEDYI